VILANTRTQLKCPCTLRSTTPQLPPTSEEHKSLPDVPDTHAIHPPPRRRGQTTIRRRRPTWRHHLLAHWQARMTPKSKSSAPFPSQRPPPSLLADSGPGPPHRAGFPENQGSQAVVVAPERPGETTPRSTSTPLLLRSRTRPSSSHRPPLPRLSPPPQHIPLPPLVPTSPPTPTRPAPAPAPVTDDG
jgi:hypothetical protein